MTAARYAARPGVAFVPIADVPGSTVALAWPEERASRATLAFVEVAREVLAAEAELVAELERPVRA